MRRIRQFVASAVALIGAVISAAFTANGFRPLSRRGYPSLYAFGYGVVASELPLQMLAPQPLALAAVSRLLGRRTATFAWLLAGLSWLGLLDLYRVGRAADRPLTRALEAGLGPERRRDSRGLWPQSDEIPSKRPGLVRMFRIHRIYAHDSNVSYGEFGRKNHLDIWHHPDLPHDGRAPVLLQVPGGAWMLGSKRGQAHPLMSHLAARGWVCVSINYRLSPRSTWPDQIVDVKRAIAWVKEHIGEYGGDPEFIAITGGSAGGHLSSLAALTPNRAEFQPDFPEVDTTVQAAVAYYGIYDFTRSDTSVHPLMVPILEQYVFKQSRFKFPDAYQAASPLSYVSPAAPPFFVLHGDNDSLVPVEQARSFSARLREVSRAPVVYAELPRAQHGFDVFGSPRAAHAALAVEQFLAEVYARGRVGPAT